MSSAIETHDGNENVITSDTNNDPHIEDMTAEISAIASQSTSTAQSATASIARKNMFLFWNSFLSSIDLELADADGQGDCCSLACLASCLNLRRSSSNKQQ